MAGAALRAGAVLAGGRAAVVEVLPPADTGAGEEVSDRAVRTRRRLHPEHARALPVLLPRADVPQPAGAAGLSGAGHRLPGLRRLRPRLAHRDLPAHG